MITGMLGLLIALVWGVMQIVLYKPLTASTHDRLMQISVELKRVDVVILSANGERALDKDAATQIEMPHHIVFRHGWHRGSTEANKSCGIAFLVKKSLCKAVKEHISPPLALRGRLAGFRLRTLRTSKDDITIFAVCAP